MVQRVLYSSVSTHDRGHLSDLEILRTAQAFNAQNQLTGFLFRSRRHFVQVLEGEVKTIDALLTRIHQDPRHRGIKTHLYGQADTRRFDTWSMGYCDITEDRADTVRQLLLENVTAAQMAVSELSVISAEYI